MNKKVLTLFMFLVFICGCLKVVNPGGSGTGTPKSEKTKIDFGDYRSETLTVKAWQALGAEDLDAVLAYTGKCIEMYAKEAEKQQASLKDFAPKEKAFDYWALNDVGTCYFIRADMFTKKGMIDEAKDAYKILIEKFRYAQCYDPGGWFWRPGEVAEEKLAELE